MTPQSRPWVSVFRLRSMLREHANARHVVAGRAAERACGDASNRMFARVEKVPCRLYLSMICPGPARGA